MSPKMASSVLLVLVIGLAMITASVLNSGYLLAKRDSGSSNSDSGSSSGSNVGNNEKSNGDSGSDSGSNDNNAGNSPGSSPKLKEAQPTTQPQQQQQPTPSETIKENPIVPTTPNPKDKPVCMIPEGCNPVNPNPNPVIGQPDFSCHFHPESPKCSPDKEGNCPGGFAHNDKGQCHPEGPCPPGFGRHDNDESGKCFRTGPFHPHSHVKVIVKEVHHTTTTKVVHKNQISGIATVFVPKVGLVEPFNCKLNENSGKIGCEFLIVKVIN